MKTLQQHKDAINIMFTALELSLARLLNAEHKNEQAIHLHAAMMQFYEKLRTLLASAEYTKFFNANLSHLLGKNDTQVESHDFEVVDVESSVPHKIKMKEGVDYTIPEQYVTQDLFSMIEFSTVISAATQKVIEDYKNKGEFVDNIGMALSIVGAIGLVAMTVCLGSAIYSASLPLQLLYLGMLMLNIIGIIATTYGSAIRLDAIKMESVNPEIAEKAVVQNLGRKLDRYSFESIQCSFFSLAPELTVTEKDLTSAQEIQQLMRFRGGSSQS